METNFAFLSVSQKELQEIHRALLARLVMEEALRREQGLEAADYPPLLERIEKLLGLSDVDAHALSHNAEDELWEYAWYTFTDEWALFRSRQDVLKELGGTAAKSMNKEEINTLVEKRYQQRFEQYVDEVDMREETAPRGKQRKKTRMNKK